MATELEVLDRLEKLLAAGCPAPWHRLHSDDPTCRCKCGQIWSDSLLLYYPDKEMGVTDQEAIANSDMVVALRNAAPALIRLAKAALFLDNVPRNTGDADVEARIGEMDMELTDAIDALRAVKL